MRVLQIGFDSVMIEGNPIFRPVRQNKPH